MSPRREGVGIFFGILLTAFLWQSERAHRENEVPVQLDPAPIERDLEVRVVYGYKDARPARFVADRYERMLLVARLTAGCTAGETVCGFSRDSRDVELFRKGNIRLRVIASSAGPDDEEDRKDPFQAMRTAHAERVFLDGLRDADVVIYNGHSRGGGGPDFRPPRLSGGAVDYEWYRARKPGMRPVLEALKRGMRESRLQLLSFLSCASAKHFVQSVESARPGLNTVTTPQLLYFADAHAATLDVLASVFSKRAETRAGSARVAGQYSFRSD